MDNKQGTFIGIGCLTLCSLYYFYKQFSQDKLAFKGKLQEMRDTISQSKKTDNKINYQAIKKGQPKVVVYPKIHNYQLNNSSYTKFVRQVAAQNLKLNRPDHFQENQIGGRFKMKDGKFQIEVDIKDCNIHTRIISQSITKNIIFSQNNSKKPLFFSSTAAIKSLQKMALYGALSYSLQNNKFILQPWFITKACESDEQTFEQLISFWQQKIYNITFKKLAIGVTIVTIAYFLIYKPIKKIWLRYKANKEGVSQGQLNYFKQRVSFYAKNQSALNCQFCKKNTISYVYQCGHLVACQECFSADQKNYKCQICGRKSKKFMKIFI